MARNSGLGLALVTLVSLLPVVAGCACRQRLAAFDRTLAAHDSATVALEEWCARRGIASPARITATAVGDAATTPIAPAIRTALGVGPDEPVRLRHVHLACGDTVLSDARNWYVPARLTPDMNHALDTSEAPFGKVVAPLGLHRQPLPATMASPDSCPAGTIRHATAVLRRDDGLAYSLVSECYTPANIAHMGAAPKHR